MRRPKEALLEKLGNWFRLSEVSLNDRPDLGSMFNDWRALISDGYVERYYRHETEESPQLRTLPPDMILRLIINDINRDRGDGEYWLSLFPARSAIHS
jgi:hypothetical protein